MRSRNVILLLLALLILAAGGALWWLYASRDALIKRAIERFGPELTGVSVKVASVKLEPLDGRGAIKGFELGNPKGFKAPHALSLGEIRLAVEPASLASDVVRVKEISLEAPSIVYERGPNGDNLTAIQRHIESQLPKSTPAKGDDKAEQAAKERRFIIERVQVRKAKVSYGGAVSVDVPDLQLHDLGKKSGGASAAEITREIWTAVTRQAIAAAPGAIRGLEDKAKGAAERLRGIFK
jgi:AsmA family